MTVMNYTFSKGIERISAKRAVVIKTVADGSWTIVDKLQAVSTHVAHKSFIRN